MIWRHIGWTGGFVRLQACSSRDSHSIGTLLWKTFRAIHRSLLTTRKRPVATQIEDKYQPTVWDLVHSWIQSFRFSIGVLPSRSHFILSARMDDDHWRLWLEIECPSQQQILSVHRHHPPSPSIKSDPLASQTTRAVLTGSLSEQPAGLKMVTTARGGIRIHGGPSLRMISEVQQTEKKGQ